MKLIKDLFGKKGTNVIGLYGNYINPETQDMAAEVVSVLMFSHIWSIKKTIDYIFTSKKTFLDLEIDLGRGNN